MATESPARSADGLFGALSAGVQSAEVTAAVTQSLGEIKYLEEQLIKAKEENERLRGELQDLNDTVFSKSFKPPSAWADREHKYMLERQQWEQQNMILEKKVKRLQADITKIKNENRSTEYEETIEKLKAEKVAMKKERDAALHEEHELKLQLMNSTGEFVKDVGEETYGRSEKTPHMEAKNMIAKLEALTGNDKSKVANILNKALHLEETDEKLEVSPGSPQDDKENEVAPGVILVPSGGVSDTASESGYTPFSQNTEELELAKAQVETLKQQVTQFKALLGEVNGDKDRLLSDLEAAWTAAAAGNIKVLGELCERLGVAASTEGSALQQQQQSLDDTSSSATVKKAEYSQQFVQFVRAITIKSDDDVVERTASEALEGDQEIMEKIKQLKADRDKLREEVSKAKTEAANTFFQKEAELSHARRELLAKLEEIEKLQAELKERKAMQLQTERENHKLKMMAKGGASTFRPARAKPTGGFLPKVAFGNDSD